MSEEPSQAWSPPEEASPVPPSEPASSNADVQRRAEVETETVRQPGLTETQEQLRRNPAAFTPEEDYDADRLLGSTVPESANPTRNERPTMVTGAGQPPKLRIHEEVDPNVSMGPRQGGPYATMSDLNEMEQRLQQKLKFLCDENQQQHKDKQHLLKERKEMLEKIAELEAQHEQELKQEKDKNAKLETLVDQQTKKLRQERDKNAKLETQRKQQRLEFDDELLDVVQGWKDKVARKDAEIRAKDAVIRAKEEEIQRLKAERDKITALEGHKLKERLENQTADSDQQEEILGQIRRLVVSRQRPEMEQQDGPQGSPPHNGFPHVLTPENGSASGPSVQGTIWHEPQEETPSPSPPSDP